MALVTKSKSQALAHHKKRQAGHHRQSKDYLKSYWPYLPMALIVVGGIGLSNHWSAKSQVLGAQSDFSSQTLLSDTNLQRGADNEAPLSLNSQLSQAAIAKAADMSQHNYWAHTSPSGKTPWDFISAAQYSYSVAGENLAYGFANADQVIAGWMQSPEHRANILDTSYQDVGFGVASSSNYLGKGPAIIVVAEYAQPISAAANISFVVPPHQTMPVSVALPSEPSGQAISRLSLVDATQPAWLVVGVSVLASSALTIFVLRNALRLRRLLLKGEAFVTHHIAIDLAFSFVFMAGYVLTRATGVIR
jgi:hypothetical protein